MDVAALVLANTTTNSSTGVTNGTSTELLSDIPIPPLWFMLSFVGLISFFFGVLVGIGCSGGWTCSKSSGKQTTTSKKTQVNKQKSYIQKKAEQFQRYQESKSFAEFMQWERAKKNAEKQSKLAMKAIRTTVNHKASDKDAVASAADSDYENDDDNEDNVEIDTSTYTIDDPDELELELEKSIKEEEEDRQEKHKSKNKYHTPGGGSDKKGKNNNNNDDDDEDDDENKESRTVDV